jgi:glycerol-3-phosphate dehydrogenase (NAD(P)+)
MMEPAGNGSSAAATCPEPGDAIGIVGAGAWGTALAQAAARAGNPVVLWDRDDAVVEEVRAHHRSPRAFPDLVLEPGIAATAVFDEVLACPVVLLVVPAQSLRDVCKRRRKSPPAVAVICAKGFERDTDLLLSEVIEAEWPGTTVACLSGPSFAAEVAKGLPTALTLGVADAALGRALASRLSSPQLRVYWTDDRTGVEIGGAVKNVLAIAAGLVIGKGLGENARAALLSRGLAELAGLGQAMGARTETLMGLSGLGDLMLTALSPTSRNTAFGMALGQGETAEAALAKGGVVEGYWTAAAVDRLARRHCVATPIVHAVAEILAGQMTVEGAIESLMSRPLRAEGLP